MAFPNGPLTSFMSPQEGPQIQSSFMPQNALSAPTSAEQLSRLSRKVAPDEEGSSLSLIKQAKDRLLAQSTGVDPLISWLAAYGSADPRNKLGAAAQAMTQAVGQQDASKQKLDLDVLQLDMAAAQKREAIAATASEAEKDRIAKAELEAKEIAAEDKRLTEKLADQKRHDREVIDGRVALAAALAGNKPLSVTVTKKIMDFADTSNKLKREAADYEQKADQFESLKPTAGFFGNIKETTKQVFGEEDSSSYLRREWINIKNQQVIQNLPKGAASDRDVRIAMEASLSNFVNPEQASVVLRGLAKIKKWGALQADFQSEFITQNPTRMIAGEDSEINGIPIRKGASYSSALKSFNEYTPYSSVFNNQEDEPEGDGNSTKSSGKIDKENPLLKSGQ